MECTKIDAGQGAPVWQRRAAALLLAAVVVYYVSMAWLNISGYFDYREFSFTDTTFFRHFGRRMAEGATLYTDLWDTKGPMVYMTYYWGYLLSGGAAWGVEAAILLYSIVATWCGYRAFRSVAGPSPAAAGVVFLTMTLGFIGWCGTTTESTYALWVLMGLALTLPVQGVGGRLGWRWLAGGALVALCVLSKTNYVGFGCFLLAYWAWRGCFWKAAAASAAGFSLVLGGFALTMYCRGNFGAMVDATVLFNLHEYHAAAPEWAEFPTLPGPAAKVLTLLCSEFQYAKHFIMAYPAIALMFGGSLAAMLIFRKQNGCAPGLFRAILLWVAVEFLTGGVKFLIYDHYYETLFVPICLASACAAARVPWAWGRLCWVGAMLAVAAHASGPWRYFRPHSRDMQVEMEALAAMAQGRNPQGRPVAVLGGSEVLYTMNALGLHSAQRYLHNAWLLGYDISPKRRQELLRELEAALEQAVADGTFLLAEEPLPVLMERHPELAPLLRGWQAVDESPQNRVFLYLPPEGIED